MIGVDSNILVRLAADDPSNPRQVEAARAFIRERADEGIYVSLPVLLESVWLLQRSFRFPHEAVLRFLVMLLDQSDFRIGDRDVVSRAVGKFRRAHQVGFADCLIEAISQRDGVSTTFTFDRRAADRVHFSILEF
jgi:predicted nucleic-acid-binding protein